MSTGPPPSNPILSAYEAFVKDTPLVTRYTISTLCCSWFLSFFFDASYALNTIPYYVIYRFEVHRLILSPLVCQSTLTLIFAYLAFVDNGKRLEHSMGSTAFGYFMLTIACLSNVSFCSLSFLLSVTSGEQGYLWGHSSGIWTILFAIIATECSRAPANDQRKLFFVKVPTLYYPLALWALYSLIGGPQMDCLISVAVGYAYGYGLLDKLKGSPTRFRRWEESILLNFTQREGWVVGHTIASDTGAASRPESSVRATNTSGNSPLDAEIPTFGGSGRALGSTRATTDAKTAMLEAAERRARETIENSV